MTETKDSVYKLLDKSRYPQTVLFSIPISLETLQQNINRSSIVYPLIIKPDGDSVMGNNVYLVENEWVLKSYIDLLQPWQYLAQEFIEWEEYSIYYYRYPSEKSWHILGITKKIFPTITGDGVSTIQEILQKHDRYHRYIHLFRDKYQIPMDDIIPNWINKQIASIGNHSKWSLFLDWSKHSNQNLVQVFDTLFHEDMQVYLYRVDLKTQSWEKLLQWEYTILEVNSWVFAEPTYMYDPSYKLLDAYKQIYQVRYHTYHIATYNHRVKKIPYMSLFEWRKNVIHFLKK